MSEPRFGFTLSSEEFPPRALVDQAVRAEDLGFDFVSISDHFHPWVGEQGHSPFVWSVLGAIASSTRTIGVGTGVTCPTVRIHPAVVAHAVATTTLLLEDRFFFGLGSGEALNEHILGHRWPPADTRLEMLEEAVAVMRRLWTGEVVDHHGRFYDVENARLFDVPEVPPPLVVSGFGAAAARLAARIGDGYFGTTPDADLVGEFRAGGSGGPCYGQLTVAVADDVDTARETVRRQWPNGGLAGQAMQDLPTWTHFEQVTEALTVDQVVGSTPCGPEVGPIVDSVDDYLDAGYDHVYFHQVGDPEAFLRLWEGELGEAVRGRTAEHRLAG